MRKATKKAATGVDTDISDALMWTAEDWSRAERDAAEWRKVQEAVATAHAVWKETRSTSSSDEAPRSAREAAGERLSAYLSEFLVPRLTGLGSSTSALWSLEQFVYGLLHENARAKWRIEQLSKQLGLRTQQREGLRDSIVRSKRTRVARAKQAAEARHGAPGGARDKAEAIRLLWASGKYSSRDICAEQECGALDMSFSSARKALRGTPDPA